MLFVISSICSALFTLLFFVCFLHVLMVYSLSINYLAMILAVLGVLGGIGITGKLRVFYHEFKHKLVSGLAGNKAKRLEIKSSAEGEFEYEYSTETEQYNPFIALAPYYFPFVTLFSVPFWTFFQQADLTVREAILVFALAFDLTFSATELDPYQSDFDAVPGGKPVGILFAISVNCFFFTICLAVCLGGFSLLGEIFYSFFWRLPREILLNTLASV